MSTWGPIEKKILTGEKLYSEGKYEDALTLFEEVIEEDPQNVAALNDAGILHFEMQNSEKSIKYLTDALSISPGNLSSILTLIDNHLVEQSYESARDTFYSYMDYIEDPEIKQRYKSLLFSGNSIQSEIERGESLYIEDDIEKAESIFKGILTIDQENTDALTNLSVIYHQNDEIEKAKDYAKSAYSLNSNDTDIRENYAALFGEVPTVDSGVKPLKLAFICGPGTTFLTDVESRFSSSYNVKSLHFTNNVDMQEIQSAMDWADITWFEWCDQILIGVSNNLNKTSKVVCRLHGYEIFSGYPSQVNWNFVDKLLFVANHKRELFHEIFPEIDVNSAVVRNGVATDKFSIATNKKNTKNLLLLGNLNYRKGLQLLIQYYRELLFNDPEYHLFIRGEWQDLRYKVYTANIIEELQLQNKITFIDEWVDDINEFMSDKSHILSFSIEESFHYSIGNGMAAGLKPVIHSWKESRDIWPNEFIFNDLNSFLKIMLDSEYSPDKYRNLLFELNLTEKSQYRALEREIHHLPIEKSLISSSNIVTPEFKDNIKYWENRYESVGGERTVGHINWDKKTYDKETKKTKNILKPFIQEISKSISLKNVLDFGCGIGRFAQILSEYSNHYYGVDPVKKVIDKNKSNFSASQKYHFGHIESGQIPFSNKKFDLIFSSFVFQHIIEDSSIKNYAKQFKKILSNDGRLLFLEILNKEEGGGHMRYRSQQEFENLFDGFSFEKIGEYHYSGRTFTILSGSHENIHMSKSKVGADNLRNDNYKTLKRQENWFSLSPYSLEDFTHLDDLIKTGTIFSIKCEQLELQHDWEVEIGINNDKNGILAQFLYYNSRDNSLHAPVEIENKNKAKLVNIIKECINNPNISLNEQIRGNIYDLNLLNDIKSNLKEYVWERIFPCTVFSPLRPFMIHMDRYRFASESINSNKVIVDAACGMGYGTKFLSKFSQNAIGIDISEESIQMAQKYYQSDNIQWKVGDVLNMNIRDHSIDVFTSMETFEHITPPEQLLSEISRVLKKDGIAFISTPNGENHRRQQVNNPYHEHEYSYDELVSIYDKFFKEVELFGSKELGEFDLIDYGRRTEYENILIKASNPINS